jgi:hypothetical protein
MSHLLTSHDVVLNDLPCEFVYDDLFIDLVRMKYGGSYMVNFYCKQKHLNVKSLNNTALNELDNIYSLIICWLG